MSENGKNFQTFFMFLLPNECKWSGFHVFPPNWKTSKAKRSINWYADYNFIDINSLRKLLSFSLF